MILVRSMIREIPYNLDNIKKYKSPENLLRHARYIPGKTKGVMWITRTGKLVGYCGWEDNWVIALEVSKEYRGRGFGEELLKRALQDGCTGLTVDRKNDPAIALYKKLGFTPTTGDGERRINMELL